MVYKYLVYGEKLWGKFYIKYNYQSSMNNETKITREEMDSPKGLGSIMNSVVAPVVMTSAAIGSPLAVHGDLTGNYTELSIAFVLGFVAITTLIGGAVYEERRIRKQQRYTGEHPKEEN